MKRKPVVGETLWMVVSGWGKAPEKPQPVTVLSVGRKYFEVAHLGRNYGRDFCLDGWVERTDYTPNAYLYESLQEIEDEKEWDRLACEIRKRFNCKVGLSLNALRNIKLIIDAESQPK